MEGSLPGIGLTLETPAALTNPADPSASSVRFAALIDDGAGQPAGAPAGNGLPPAGNPLPLPGQVLPQSVALFRPVAAAGQPELPAASSTAPGEPLIPSLPGIPGTDTEQIDLSASRTGVAPASGSGIAQMLRAEGIPGAAEMPGAEDPSGGATDQGRVDDASPVRTTAAAPADVVEMVRQLERGFAAQPDPGLRPVATPLSRAMNPETTPGLPASHTESGRLPDRPALIPAQTLTVTPAPTGDPVAPVWTLANASRAGLNPEPAIQAGLVTALARQGVQDPAASPDGSDLTDLPFESIRVTVREAGGERPLISREPGFQLPGPRQPIGDPQWARSLGERLAVVVRGEHQTARMSLNPAHLGPIDIQLRLQDDQAQLWLTAQHPQAREALESAMPRLREMFAQQGIDLSQQGSSGQPREQGTDEQSAPPTVVAATGSGGEESGPGSGPAWVRRETGLIDAYA